jgi:protoporphyrinogen oxidase
VSTIPLGELLEVFSGVPSRVVDAYGKLRYNPSIFVLVGLRECSAEDITAIYFPEADFVFHRVCFLHTFGAGLLPRGKYSALAEISCDGQDSIWESSDEVVTLRVVGDLVQTGLIRAEDVLVTDVKRVKYSYVVNELHSRRNYEVIHAFFAGQELELLGRFAEFEYWNIDQCFARAADVAGKLNLETGG